MNCIWFRPYSLIIRSSLVILMLASALSASMYGQIPEITNVNVTPMPGSGHDYIHLLNETVSPAKGGVSINIDIPMPKGRGLSVPFGFRYDTGFYAPWVSGGLFGVSLVSLSPGGWS